MRIFTYCSFAVVLFLANVAAARREPVIPGVAVEVSPMAGHRYMFTLRPTSWNPAQVVADHRLLRFEVQPPTPEGARRPPRAMKCQHVAAPRRVQEERVVRLGMGTDRATYSEWFDIRMYCWGKALAALEKGATLRVKYGFSSRGRRRWVARSTSNPVEEVYEVVGTDLAIQPAQSATPPPSDFPELGPLVVELKPIDVVSPSAVTFRVSLRASEGRLLVYPRHDLFSFHVSGPLGDADCVPGRTLIVPIVDFYKVLTPRVTSDWILDASLVCPENTFGVAGVYDVTPSIELIYDGSDHGRRAVTGSRAGATVPVRVRADGRGYVEQAVSP